MKDLKTIIDAICKIQGAFRPKKAQIWLFHLLRVEKNQPFGAG